MNIVLVDRIYWIVEEILKKTNWIVEFLIIDDSCEVSLKELISNYPDRIKQYYTLSKFMKLDSTKGLDFGKVEKYKYCQTIGDAGLRRICDDYQFSRYMFYMSASFWIDFFDTHSVDACLIMDLLHGYPCDVLVEKICKDKNIPCYNIYDHNYKELAVFNANSNQIIPASEDKDSFSEDSINSVADYASNNDSEKEWTKSWKWSSKLLYKIGGARLIQYVVFLRNKCKLEINYKKISLVQYISNEISIRNLKKHIRKLYSPVNYKEKYIIYFLHFEPEAVITSFNEIVDSQLVNIKMIADALPKGWTLYVKEHPDWYKLNNILFSYQISNIPTFLTRYYFDTIAKMQNVKLVDYKIPASKLIENCQAIATIAGTVIYEAVRAKKNILIFGNNRLLYSKCKDFYIINSMNDLKNSFEKIRLGNSPTYDDFISTGDKYLIKRNTKAWKTVINTIKFHLEKSKFNK